MTIQIQAVQQYLPVVLGPFVNNLEMKFGNFFFQSRIPRFSLNRALGLRYKRR